MHMTAARKPSVRCSGGVPAQRGNGGCGACFVVGPKCGSGRGRGRRRESKCFAVWGHSLNVLLLVGVMASLIGATLAFVTLDLNDLRFNPKAEENRGVAARALSRSSILTGVPASPPAGAPCSPSLLEWHDTAGCSRIFLLSSVGCSSCIGSREIHIWSNLLNENNNMCELETYS